MLLNLNIPHVDCFIRPAFLFNLESHHDAPPQECRIVGVASVAGRAMGFHVLTRVPIHGLCWAPHAPPRPLHELQLWDCFGDEVTFERFAALELNCTVHLPRGDGELVPHEAQYIGTFDWLNNAYSDTPQQHKCAHWLRLSDGNFALQPNNRIYPWHEPAFVDEPLKPGDNPGYKTNHYVWRCETRKWLADDAFFYSEKTGG